MIIIYFEMVIININKLVKLPSINASWNKASTCVALLEFNTVKTNRTRCQWPSAIDTLDTNQSVIGKPLDKPVAEITKCPPLVNLIWKVLNDDQRINTKGPFVCRVRKENFNSIKNGLGFTNSQWINVPPVNCNGPFSKQIKTIS